jgi:hypothetical protein
MICHFFEIDFENSFFVKFLPVFSLQFGARHAGTSTRWVVTRGWCPSMAIVRPDSCVMASLPPSVAWIHGKIKKIFGQPWGLYGTIYYVW